MAVNWPNLIGDGAIFLGVSVILAALGVGCFGARTYTSWQCTKRFLLDYWLSLLTFTLCVSSQAFFVVSVTFGLGYHVRDLGHADVVVALRTSWASQLAGIAAAATGKLSVVAFLAQVRGRGHRGRPWFLYFVGASTVVVNAVVVVLILVQCAPLERLWDERVPGRCRLRTLNHHYAYFQGGYSALSDAALALYPIHLISRLQVSTRMKVGVSFLLGFGLLAAGMAVVKTVQLTNLAHHDEDMDITFFVARLALATLVEAWIVMAVGCIPTLRPLMRAVMRRLRATPSARHRKPLGGLDNYPGMSSAPVGSTTATKKSGVASKNSAGTGQSTLRDSATIELRKVDGRDSAEGETGLAGGFHGDKIVVATDVDVSYGRRKGVGEEDDDMEAEKQADLEWRIRGFGPI